MTENPLSLFLLMLSAAVLVPLLVAGLWPLPQLRRLLLRGFYAVWPVTVVGDDEAGWSARLPGDLNWVWAARRETAIFGCRQRALGR